MINYFEVLNVSENAELEVIQASYRALVKKYHPDSTKVNKEVASEKMQLINEAYDVLSNDIKRREHIQALQNEKSKKVNQNMGSNTYANEPKAQDIKVKTKKKPFYKKLWLWFFVILFWNSCGSETDKNTQNNSGTGQQIVEEDQINTITPEQMNELPIYSMDYLNAYLEVNNIEIPTVRKKSQMEKALTDDSEMISLKSSERFWGEGIEYVATSEQTELQYVGEMKNNKPHGWGRIMMLVSAIEYEDEQGTKIEFNEYYDADDYSDMYVVLLYVGQFKDGSYDGYGWEYIPPFKNSDELANSIYARNLGYDYMHISSDIAQNILNTCNPVGYMGEFKKGEYHGEGIKIQYPIREVPIDMDVEQQVSLFGARLDREIVIYVSEYENGQRNGNCKEYLFGKLYYSGTVKNGYYDGTGTLYNEDGSVKYSGEWNMGDYDDYKSSDMDKNQTSSGQVEVVAYTKRYDEIIDTIFKEYSEMDASIKEMGYVLYDINQDNYEELIIYTATCQEDALYEIYSTNGIEVMKIGDILAGATPLYKEDGDVGIYGYYRYLEQIKITYYYIEDNQLKEIDIYEGNIKEFVDSEGIINENNYIQMNMMLSE